MTSFFGMNIAELGTGDVSMKIFVESTAALLALVAIVWLLSGWVGRQLNTVSSNFYGLRIRLPMLRKLASISPTAAFWLACFAMSHPPRLLQNFLVDLGIWGVLGLGKDWDRPELDDQDNLQKWRETTSPFWLKRGMQIMKMTNQMGWQKKRWYQR